MSRFPLLPLLLSFSTTLQSACLENKCTVSEFKDNDECKLASSDMSVPPGDPKALQTYILQSPGAKKWIDSIALLEGSKTINSIEYSSQIALLFAPRTTSDNDVLAVANIPQSCTNSNCQLTSTEKTLGNTDPTFFNRMVASRNQIRVISSSTLYSIKWKNINNPIVLISNSTAKSLASDENDRIYAAILSSNVSPQPPVSVSYSPVFLMSNLYTVQNTNPKRLLIGNFGNTVDLKLIVWDNLGKFVGILHQDNMNLFSSLTANNLVPDICVVQSMNCNQFPVALGDLDQDGLSDLVIAKSDGIKIHYAIDGTGKPSFPEATNYPDALKTATNVQAIAVSIPNGDDPPKLVWATSSFKPTTEKSPTGTNTITINVLQIQK
jgi:hypothetical protein